MMCHPVCPNRVIRTDYSEWHGLQKSDHEIAEIDQSLVLRKSNGRVAQDHGDSEPKHDLPSSQEGIGEAQGHGSEAVTHAYQGRLKIQ